MIFLIYLLIEKENIKFQRSSYKLKNISKSCCQMSNTILSIFYYYNENQVKNYQVHLMGNKKEKENKRSK